MRPLYRNTCLCLLLLLCTNVKAQLGFAPNETIVSTENISNSIDSSKHFVIRDIYIQGNNKTRPSTILRELPFKVNEEYPLDEILKKFQVTKTQLMNTGLFRKVIVSMKSIDGYDVFVNIEVEERWYIYPMPHLKIVDDSFQEWWRDRDKDMNRINYGFKLNYRNISGRNDKLSVTLVNGYTKQLSARYEGLFLDKDLKWSLNTGFAYGKKKEVNYNTFENKQLFFKYNDFIHSYFRASIDVSYRRAIKTKHTFTLGYYNESVADTVFNLNPKFATNNRQIRFPELAYKLNYFDVDFIPYPTKGYAAEVLLSKKGFGGPINVWQLTTKGSGSWQLGQKSFFNLRLLGMIKLPFEQPYITQGFMGGNDVFMQGYEYYSIDGVAGGYAKAAVHRQVLNKNFSIPSKRIKRLNDIPFKVYAKAFVNAGYAYAPNTHFNNLNNRMLYSTGLGIDIVTFTDFVIKLEWSLNQLGENGLYLHRRNYF